MALDLALVTVRAAALACYLALWLAWALVR